LYLTRKYNMQLVQCCDRKWQYSCNGYVACIFKLCTLIASSEFQYLGVFCIWQLRLKYKITFICLKYVGYFKYLYLKYRTELQIRPQHGRMELWFGNIFMHFETSSSAIAERSCGVSCLSVVSFNSRYAERTIFYYWLLRLQIYRCVQLNSMFSSVRGCRPCYRLW